MSASSSITVVHRFASEEDCVQSNANISFRIASPIFADFADSQEVLRGVVDWKPRLWNELREAEKSGYGRIVNGASVPGKEGNPNAAAHSASKAGVIEFTKSLGNEMARPDVCINCIMPAAKKTSIRHGANGPDRQQAPMVFPSSS
jgi:NAD(P)-dependent dehydrogenase (short-subunit alcohol dehydrogenase family)